MSCALSGRGGEALAQGLSAVNGGNVREVVMDGGEGGTWAGLFAEWVADLLASKRPSMMPPNGRGAQLGWPASKGDDL